MASVSVGGACLSKKGANELSEKDRPALGNAWQMFVGANIPSLIEQGQRGEDVASKLIVERTLQTHRAAFP